MKVSTVKEIGSAPEGIHSVSGVPGLYVRKRTKTVQFFFRWSKTENGKKTSFKEFLPIGTTLHDARLTACNWRELLKTGSSPRKFREEQKLAEEKLRKEEGLRIKQEAERKENTFKRVADLWFRDQASKGRWKNDPVGQKKIWTAISRYAFPSLGELVIDEIYPRHLFLALSPEWVSKPGALDKVYKYVREVFEWAIAMEIGGIKENPANLRGRLGVLLRPLTKQRAGVRNMPALPYAQIPDFIYALLNNGSSSALAVVFAILTATRCKPVVTAKWADIDFENRIWKIPREADKVKGGSEHSRLRDVCLSDQVIELLGYLKHEGPYIFSSSTSNLSHMSGNDPNRLIRRLHFNKLVVDGVGWVDPETMDRKTNKPSSITLHGTARASFRTWAKSDSLGNNRLFDQEAVDLCLLHSKNDAYNGAYDRSKLLRERRMIMQAWGDYCFSKVNLGDFFL